MQINHIRTPIPRVCDWNGLEWTYFGHILVTLSGCLNLLLDYLVDKVLSSAVQNL